VLEKFPEVADDRIVAVNRVLHLHHIHDVEDGDGDEGQQQQRKKRNQQINRRRQHQLLNAFEKRDGFGHGRIVSSAAAIRLVRIITDPTQRKPS